VRNGLVGESDVVRVLADQLKLDVYRPSRHPVDPGLAETLPFEMAEKLQVSR